MVKNVASISQIPVRASPPDKGDLGGFFNTDDIRLRLLHNQIAIGDGNWVGSA